MGHLLQVNLPTAFFPCVSITLAMVEGGGLPGGQSACCLPQPSLWLCEPALFSLGPSLLREGDLRREGICVSFPSLVCQAQEGNPHGEGRAEPFPVFRLTVMLSV